MYVPFIQYKTTLLVKVHSTIGTRATLQISDVFLIDFKQRRGRLRSIGRVKLWLHSQYVLVGTIHFWF